MNWVLGDVELGDRFERDGIIYRVVGIVTDPVVVVQPDDERDGGEQEHFVIGSRLFAEFKKVALLEPGRHA